MNEIKPPSSDAELLIAGARSYVDASTALLYYEREVQRRCRNVMQEFLGAYTSILGVVLKSEDIAELAGPNDAKWDGTEAWLGAKVANDGEISGIRWWVSYCCLAWSCEDPKFYCSVGEWFPNRKAAAKLAAAFGPHDNIEVFDNEISIYKALAFEQAVNFDDVIRGLFKEWIGLWKKAGGMKKVFKGL